ncbi:uncharacterized protein LOC101755388 isoform X2 [Setaria italica]|nr:uncharacterized protein LOC101755388 isoform X2 [Setaria italica]
MFLKEVKAYPLKANKDGGQIVEVAATTNMGEENENQDSSPPQTQLVATTAADAETESRWRRCQRSDLQQFVNTPVPEVDPVTSNSQWDFSMHVPQRSLTPDGQLLSLLHQIAEVALDIKEASETVLQHKEDCIELDKRVSRVSALLSKLKNTEMVEKQAMKNELKKLLQTFPSWPHTRHDLPEKRHCHHVRLQPALHAIQTAKRIIGSTGASRECYNCSHCQ